MPVFIKIIFYFEAAEEIFRLEAPVCINWTVFVRELPGEVHLSNSHRFGAFQPQKLYITMETV